MAHPLIDYVEAQEKKASLPLLMPGDTVKVMVRIKEGNKERLQALEGVVLRIRGEGINKTFTVRKVFQGIGVERTFLLHSPKLESITVLRRGRVRRARLYYLRERIGKAARIREKTTGICAPGKAGSLMNLSKKMKKAQQEAAPVAAAAPATSVDTTPSQD
jgi:large subunit ribosomal protein L19